MRRSPRPLELWAGVECTHNRVRDRWFDQLDRTGHAGRPADLDLIAATGIRTLRYPVLWERVSRLGGDPDWSWADERLGRLRELGVRPIVGLLHHGSGPPTTSLVDPAFPTKFAAYARAFAERYPWVDAYAPINEPLTTARFAGLYGIWHPHGTDPRVFARAFVNQCRAVALAMRQIRAVNPAAELVQNEDVGRVFATPALSYEADLQNERRWLTFDLLAGRIDRQHPMWTCLAQPGIDVRELESFVEDPCSIDVFGVDYYITSERMLDERIDRYPDRAPGGNGRHVYVDLEAVRVCHRLNGWTGALRETWQRYGAPMAVTEAHIACTREEQLRWLRDAWTAAERLRQRGADVRAVTVWSLFGAFDWNRLVTHEGGFYESGAFDLRAPAPRPTAVATMMRGLATHGAYSVPAMDGPGWWDRDDRFHYPVVRTAGPGSDADRHSRRARSAQPVLIVGGTGAIGGAFAEACLGRGLLHVAVGREQLELLDPAAIRRALEELRPWAVVNAAGIRDVDRAEAHPSACRAVNVSGGVALARACDRAGVPSVALSCDQIFDGSRGMPYREEDATEPLNVLGCSKVELEQWIARDVHSALVVRTAAVFGCPPERDVFTGALSHISMGREVRAADDRVVSPTYAPHLADAVLDLLIDGEVGVWHLTNAGAVTPADALGIAALALGLDASRVRAVSSGDLGLIADRPSFAALTSSRGQLLPTFDQGLSSFVDALTRVGAVKQRSLVPRD
jgi:dTDP-4-dehydrorhamnose reductase